MIEESILKLLQFFNTSEKKEEKEEEGIIFGDKNESVVGAAPQNLSEWKKVLTTKILHKNVLTVKA